MKEKDKQYTGISSEFEFFQNFGVGVRCRKGNKHSLPN